MPISTTGTIDMFDAQIFAEKILKTQKLIPPLVSEHSWTGPFDHDIAGAGLGAAKADSLSQCKDLCVVDPACKAIQYSGMETFQDKNCFLFDNQADGGSQFQHFQLYKLAREACNIVTDAAGTQMICPPLYEAHAGQPGVCNLAADAQGCAAAGLDVDCDPRQYILAPGVQWPSQSWDIPQAGAPTDEGATMKFTTGRWATSGAPTSMCEASCGMLGEIGTACEAPSADDLGDRPNKPCCFEWKINGDKVPSLPKDYSHINNNFSLSVTIPAQAGFDIGLATFMQDLPISPHKRNLLAKALWESGVSSLDQLGGVNSNVLAKDLDLSAAIKNLLEAKVDKAWNSVHSGPTLELIRNQGLFRGVRKMRNIEETMLGSAVRLSAPYAGRNDAQLSFAVAYTPDYSSSQLTVEGASESKFRSLNKVIMKAGLSTATGEVKNIGEGVGIGDSPNNQANVKMPYQGKSPLPDSGTSYERAVYNVEPRVGISMSPTMLEPTEGFEDAIHAVVSKGTGSITARRFFELYGTHTCPNALFGGWLRYTSVAKGSNVSSTADMKKAVVAAIAAETGHSTHSSLLEVSNSTDNSSNATTAPAPPPFSVSVFKDWKGGDGQSGFNNWRSSLAKTHAAWSVIDRYQGKCIPHWYWVSQYPRLRFHLCDEYRKERAEGMIPYKLVKKNVQCKSMKKLQLDNSTATVQPSLTACGKHVFEKFGKAFFIYGDPAVVQENVTHGYVNSGVGPCMTGNQSFSFASVTANSSDDACRSDCDTNTQCQGYSVNSTNFCFTYESAGLAGNGTNVTEGAAGIAAYGTCYTKLASQSDDSTNSTLAEAATTTTTTIEPNSTNNSVVSGIPVKVTPAPTTTTTTTELMPLMYSVDSTKESLSLLDQSNGTNSSNSSNATQPPENCVVFLEEHDCEAGDSAEGVWDFYQADGVPDMCGPPPPGMDDAADLNYCHDNQYEVLNDYPDRVCVDCYKDCPAGNFLSGCGGTNAGECTLCGSCPAGQYRVGCGQYSEGQCSACPVIEGPFKAWEDGLVPCQFECFAPATPSGNTCQAPTVCSSPAKGMLAHRTVAQELLALGNCEDKVGEVHWGNELVTPEAHCGEKFKPIRWNVEFLGEGSDNQGQWTVRDCDSAAHMSVVNKTLMFHNDKSGFERFTFRDSGNGGFHLLASGTQECIKAIKKPGFQLMHCPDCCDSFVFANH
jgi:hypothetical protein